MPRQTLALFFTMDSSLRAWHEAGLIERDTQLYALLHEQGWDTIFVTYGDADDAQFLPPDAPFRVLSRPAGMDRATYKRRLYELHGDVLRSVDVIKSHQVHGGRYAAQLARQLNKPYIARCGYLPSYFMAQEGASLRQRIVNFWEEATIFHRADAISVPSESEIRYLRRRYRVSSAKAHAFPNWIDTDTFQPDARVKKHPRRICYIGRFEPQKDPLTLVEAVKDLPDIELLMIGNGSLKEAIEARVRDYRLQATLLGRTSNLELPHHLNSAAIYVLPTHYEGGSPKTLLEAMACGLPVVSTDAFGVDEAYTHGQHGLKCRPGDVAGFRQAIQTLLADPDSAAQMGQQGRQHIIRHYAIDRALERELTLLSLVSRNRLESN